MSSEIVDRDLLFAILAVEHRLISRDAFFTAAHAWSFDKSSSIKALLVRRSALTEAASADFAEVVDRHLREHGGDIARCLKAVAEPLRSGTAHALRPNPDPDLRRFVGLLEPHPKSGTEPAERHGHSSPLPMAAEPPKSEARFDNIRISDSDRRPWPPPRFLAGRFAAVSRIDGDGMGVIYIGYDREEIGRVVVLKTIRDDVSPTRAKELSRRLSLEGHIHGQLEHPNILPVYGTGVTATGLPFIALQYIRKGDLHKAISNFHAGRPIVPPGQESSPYQDLLQYAREDGLSEPQDTPGQVQASPDPPVDEPAARKDGEVDSANAGSPIRFDQLRGDRLGDFLSLLRRFTDVCNAVGYAHNRGVLHRDLKPGNIMLGNNGETFLIDFGLARLTDMPEPGITCDDPVFADNVSQPGIGRAPGTVAYMAPEQLAGLNHRVDARTDIFALGLILHEILTGTGPFTRNADEKLKALTTEARYQFDLREYLHDAIRAGMPDMHEANRSIPRPLAAICRKALAFEQKDRYQTAAELAADVNRWLADEPVEAYRPEERTLEKATRWARKNRGKAAAAVAIVLLGTVSSMAGLWMQASYTRRIESQRDTAEAREKMAIDAVKQYSEAVTKNEQLKNRPELEELRKELLKAPIEFYKKLRDDLQATKDTRPESLASLADGLFELGLLTGEIGDKQDAIISFAKVGEIIESLTAIDPHDIRFRNVLAKSNQNLGDLEADFGRADAARIHYMRSIAIFEGLIAEYPNMVEYRRGMASALNNLGVLEKQAGKIQISRATLKQSIEAFEKLALANTTDPEFKSGLAQALANLGNLEDMHGEDEAARIALVRSIEILSELVEFNPASAEFRSDLGGALINLGAFERGNGRTDAAIISYKQAVDLFEALVISHPTVTVIRTRFALALDALGDQFRLAGNSDDARVVLKKSIENYEVLIQANPKVLEFKRGFARALTNLGILEDSNGNPEAARVAWLRANDHFETLAREFSGVSDFLSDLGGSYSNLALVENDPHIALDLLFKAIAMQNTALRNNPNNNNYLQFMQNHWANAIYALSVVGKSNEYDKAMALSAKLTADFPDNPVFGEIKCQLNNSFSWFIASMPSREPVEYTKAINLAEDAVRLNPENASALNTLGVAQFRAEHFSEAAATLAKSLELNKQAAKGIEQPGDLAFLAMSQWKLGQKTEAQTTYARLAESMKRPEFAQDREARQFFREATNLLYPRTLPEDPFQR